jgi:predicted nucleic acid-binding Zn ribbon protein
MELVPIKPERMAQLEDYAQRRSQSPVEALDEVLGAYLEWERAESEEAIQGIRRAYEDVKAGRTRPAIEFLDELRRKHSFPG